MSTSLFSAPAHGLLRRWPIRTAPRVFTWLFQASAATLREVAADPRHLGAEIGALSILHTWGQTLVRHPPRPLRRAGGRARTRSLALDIPTYAGFFLPVKVLSRVFSGKCCRGAPTGVRANSSISLEGASTSETPPRGGPSSTRSSKPTGWSANRPSVGRPPSCATSGATPSAWQSAITACSPSTVSTSFARKDYAHGDARRTMTLSAIKLFRRFVQHILPRGFVRIRAVDLRQHMCRVARVALARTLLATPPAAATSTPATAAVTTATETAATLSISAVRRCDDRRGQSSRRATSRP